MATLPAYVSSAGEYFISVRGVVSILAKVALGAITYFGVRTGYTWLEVQKFSLPPVENIEPSQTIEDRANRPLEYYDVITSRNIFGAKKAERAAAPSSAPLTLRLVATHVGKDGNAFAIIEHTKKNTQDVFDLASSSAVYDQGKLVQILDGSVKIERNGREETLILEESKTTPRTGGGPVIAADQKEFSISETELSEEMANLPRLLSQARAVPYFRNGVSVGMRLFAIRRGSLYEKLGLKNGDIVKSVNNTSLADPAEALKIFEQLKSERDISVNVERMGEDSTLHYRIQ